MKAICAEEINPVQSDLINHHFASSFRTIIDHYRVFLNSTFADSEVTSSQVPEFTHQTIQLRNALDEVRQSIIGAKIKSAQEAAQNDMARKMILAQQGNGTQPGPQISVSNIEPSKNEGPDYQI